MSEAEKQRRYDYKQQRKKWLMIQAIAIAVVAVLVLSSFLVYAKLNKTYYIHYKENANVDYKVQISDNDFYDEEYLKKGNAYISSLIENIVADFSYSMHMDAKKVDFDYTYKIDANLVIIDKASGKSVYSPTFVLKPTEKVSVKGDNKLEIKEHVDIDYVKYNDMAKRFGETYQLTDAFKSSLAVKMTVNVLSQCEEFEENSENTYYISLNIPLAQQTLVINSNASIIDAESRVLAYTTGINKNIFKVIGIVLAVIDVLLAGFAVFYIYKTRNEDINYTIKVKRLLSAYRSYIQQIKGDFDFASRQVVVIKTFTEMLGIRDTIQAPILMSENEDKTRSQFVIPTNTDIVYMFEIKVDNYDKLYGIEKEDN